ncbi:Gfo/Idh/MocA family protein [Desulfogranum japonicum]|uniref:Gfo/Idh/MocA family protein n=1 Tax=Desulfogranum japonicum TaxID=231447 RepID=UPI00040D8722|nr:Gfo/Idh/MocA family oxidoreductase [Desulfogranum japonicum]
MSTLKVGVIGVGYLGRFHAQKYQAMEDVDLVAVVDTDYSTAQRVAEECQCDALNDIDTLLTKVDAVSIVVPTSFHHQVAKQCLQAGIDVLVEKPFTVTLEEADELIALAAENKRVLQVGHLERFNPAVIAMQPLLNNPLFIEAHRISVFKDRGTDVDVVLDLMIHDIDIILSVVNAPIETIHTVGSPVITKTTDIANARIIFANGCTANVTVSRISLDNMRRMRIFQPGRYMSVDFGKKEVMSVELKDNAQSPFPLPDIKKHGFSEQDILELELTDFIKHVRQRTRPLVSGEEGRRALEVALEVVKQITENRKKVSESLGNAI